MVADDLSLAPAISPLGQLPTINDMRREILDMACGVRKTWAGARLRGSKTASQFRCTFMQSDDRFCRGGKRDGCTQTARKLHDANVAVTSSILRNGKMSEMVACRGPDWVNLVPVA